jgi:molybdopterin synthase catalytic subunit
MHIEIEFTREPIARPQEWAIPLEPETGALVEFCGIVRETEGAAKIASLSYEAYSSMAGKVMREIIAGLEKKHACQAIRVVHRLGVVPRGESAIYVGIRSCHRQEGFLMLQEFMDVFKKDVPIWKRS